MASEDEDEALPFIFIFFDPCRFHHPADVTSSTLPAASLALFSHAHRRSLALQSYIPVRHFVFFLENTVLKKAWPFFYGALLVASKGKVGRLTSPISLFSVRRRRRRRRRRQPRPLRRTASSIHAPFLVA